MADVVPTSVQAAALEGVDVLQRARDRLAPIGDPAAIEEVRWQVVQEAADHLARAASDPSCPPVLGAIFLDWRDHLGSYVLAARALAELDVHPDLAEQLLRRGLDEAIGESPQRILDMRA